jgi:hypothetical protein
MSPGNMRAPVDAHMPGYRAVIVRILGLFKIKISIHSAPFAANKVFATAGRVFSFEIIRVKKILVAVEAR